MQHQVVGSVDNLKRPAKWLYHLLGIAVTGLALVSLIQRLFSVGLHPVLEQVLGSYRATIHPLMTVAASWMLIIWPGFKFPQSLLDAYAISFLGATAWLRAVVTDRARMGGFRAGVRRNLLFLVVHVVICALMGLSLYGLFVVALIPMIGVVYLITRNERRIEDTNWIDDMFVFVCTGAFGASVFFVINAFAPSS